MGFGWFCLLLTYFNDVSYSLHFNWKVCSVEWEIRAEQGLSGFSTQGFPLLLLPWTDVTLSQELGCGQVYLDSLLMSCSIKTTSGCCSQGIPQISRPSPCLKPRSTAFLWCANALHFKACCHWCPNCEFSEKGHLTTPLLTHGEQCCHPVGGCWWQMSSSTTHLSHLQFSVHFFWILCRTRGPMLFPHCIWTWVDSPPCLMMVMENWLCGHSFVLLLLYVGLRRRAWEILL